MMSVKLLRVHLAHWDMSGEMEDISSLDSNTERCGHLWIAALIPQYTHTHTHGSNSTAIGSHLPVCREKKRSVTPYFQKGATRAEKTHTHTHTGGCRDTVMTQFYTHTDTHTHDEAGIMCQEDRHEDSERMSSAVARLIIDQERVQQNVKEMKSRRWSSRIAK